MGISLITNFDVNTTLPIDSKTVKADITARNGIDVNNRFQGLRCFVQSTQKNYQLRGGTADAYWVNMDDLADDILAFDTSARKYYPHASAGAGRFYTGTSNPSNTNRLNYDGYFYASKIYSNDIINSGIGTTFSQLSTTGMAISISGFQCMSLQPNAADGATSIAYKMGSATTYSNATAKLLSISNYLTEKFYINKDGNPYVGTGLFTENGSLKHLTIKAGDAVGAAGTDAGHLYLQAGQCLHSDGASLQGTVYILPGYSVQNSQPPVLSLGDSSYSLTMFNIVTDGSGVNVGLGIYPKGSGPIGLGSTNNPTSVGGYLVVENYIQANNDLTFGGNRNAVISTIQNNNNAQGYNIIIRGGYAAYPGNNGGDIHIQGGSHSGASTGKIYIGTGSAGSNALATATTSNILYYNTTTGQVTYGAAPSGSNPTSGILEWVTDKYQPYSDANKAAGRFYTYTSTAPTNNTQLAWDGYFYATRQYGSYHIMDYLQGLGSDNISWISAGSSLQLTASGAASNIGITIVGKGTGYVEMQMSSSSRCTVTSTNASLVAPSGQVYLGTSGNVLGATQTSKVLYYNTSTGLVTYGDKGVAGLEDFGDGSDGDVTISETTTLTRNMNYNNLTINSSITLNTAGYIVKVRGTLTLNSSSAIACNGNTGDNASGGTPGTGATPPYTTPRFPGQPIPASGGTGVTALTAGTSSNSTNTIGSTSSMTTGSTYTHIIYSAGGGGGGGARGATFTSGVVGSAIPYGRNGIGGGTYAGSGSVQYGGGGGGSGAGYQIVYAYIITGSGNITAIGGNGGNGLSDGTNKSGAGAGGNGGVVLLFYRNKSGWSGALTVTGGSGGATGQAASASQSGISYQCQL